MRRTKLVRVPVDILENLGNDYPNVPFSSKFRMMFKEYNEMKQLKLKLNKAGKLVYGNAWEKRYNRK